MSDPILPTPDQNQPSAGDCGCSDQASQVGSACKIATPEVPSSQLTEDRVREQLKQVIDPELFVNIVDLGLVYLIDLQPSPTVPGAHDVRMEMTLTSPMCPAGPQLVGNSRQVIEALPNVASVDVKVVMDPPWSPDKMSDDAKDQLNIF